MIWRSTLWLNKTKITLFGFNDVQWVWCCHGNIYKKKCLVSTFKHGGRNIIVWVCTSSSDIDAIINAEGHCNTIEWKHVTFTQMLRKKSWSMIQNMPIENNRFWRNKKSTCPIGFKSNCGRYWKKLYLYNKTELKDYIMLVQKHSSDFQNLVNSMLSRLPVNNIR